METPSLAWQLTLIRIYLFVCTCYRQQLWTLAQRLSNNHQPRFTDQEVLTIYLFGIIQKRRTIREIYDYTGDHLADWFPEMPSYGGYIQRLNRLSALFAPLIAEALVRVPRKEASRCVGLVDSMPIIVAHEKRSSHAKVAPELADKGYCASKQSFFYGVKLHIIGQRRRAAMPVPAWIGLTSGSENDLMALRQVLPRLKGGQLYGDKAYADGPMQARLAREQDLEMLTPAKKKRGQPYLSAAQQLWSEAVSRVRQPIESLFSWINEKTGIQCASKVRSYRGLLVHVFGRLAAAMLLLTFNS